MSPHKDHTAELMPTAEPTTVASYTKAIALALMSRGIAPAGVFAKAGVIQDTDNDPTHRLPMSALTRLFRACVEATDDPYFGLAVAQAVYVSNLHALGFGLMASSSLMDFCHRLARYFRLVSQVATVELQEQGDRVVLRMHLDHAVCGESEDAWQGLVVRFMRMFHMREFHPLEVRLHHACPPGGAEPYERYFHAPITFGEVDSCLVLARSDLDSPLQGACFELAQANDEMAASYLARIERSDVVVAARAVITQMLASGECTRRRVADALHLSEATLQQRLLLRNTSFQALLDDTRRIQACSYLRQSALSVTEVTFLLGFGEVSSFTRAFKRWTGMSPSSYRDSGTHIDS